LIYFAETSAISLRPPRKAKRMARHLFCTKGNIGLPPDRDPVPEGSSAGAFPIPRQAGVLIPFDANQKRREKMAGSSPRCIGLNSV
jgi:hypothetical protein